jgi:hypothetical protein
VVWCCWWPGCENPPRVASGTDRIGEEREAAASLGTALRASLLLASLFARQATDRERKRSQAPLGNLYGTLKTRPVLARVEPDERLLDPAVELAFRYSASVGKARS